MVASCRIELRQCLLSLFQAQLAYISAPGFAQGVDFCFTPLPDGALGASQKLVLTEVLWEVIFMTKTSNMKLKGFTLIELIVVIAIIGALSCILIPTISGFVKEAKINAAITDARTIKQAIEFSLVNNLAITDEDTSGAFNKTLYLDQNRDRAKRQTETVGAFSQVSWVAYRKNQLNNSASQKVDKTIAGALDNAFTEEWKTGKSTNAMKYNSVSKNCAQYLKDNDTNFGLVVVYDTMGTVRLMQLYRKGVLVTYVNNEYIANTDPYAHFIGEGTWDTIYRDCGAEAPEEVCQISLKNGQVGNDGRNTSWY